MRLEMFRPRRAIHTSVSHSPEAARATGIRISAAAQPNRGCGYLPDPIMANELIIEAIKTAPIPLARVNGHNLLTDNFQFERRRYLTRQSWIH